MIKKQEQGNLYKEGFIWVSVFRGKGPITMMAAVQQAGLVTGVAESSHLPQESESAMASERKANGIWTLKACPWQHTFSSKAASPNLLHLAKQLYQVGTKHSNTQDYGNIASKALGRPVLTSLVLGLQANTSIRLLTCVLGTELGSLCLCGNHFTTSHPPSLKEFLLHSQRLVFINALPYPLCFKRNFPHRILCRG